MMWPFSRSTREPEDTREPSPAAIAVAKSLAEEPGRWHIPERNIAILMHDSGIEVDVEDGWIRAPALSNEPASNSELLKAAADAWIAARLPVATPVEKEQA